jgi:cytochrome c peroxidase
MPPWARILKLGVMLFELSRAEEDDIVAFLDTLTGQLLKIEYPILPVRTDRTPEPSLK